MSLTFVSSIDSLARKYGENKDKIFTWSKLHFSLNSLPDIQNLNWHYYRYYTGQENRQNGNEGLRYRGPLSRRCSSSSCKCYWRCRHGFQLSNDSGTFLTASNSLVVIYLKHESRCKNTAVIYLHEITRVSCLTQGFKVSQTDEVVIKW